MKNLLLLLICAWNTKFSAAQIPVSHLSKVTYTASSTYSVTSTLNLKDFNLCATWNAGAYGGWIIIDLHDTIQVTRINWWIDATPGGDVDELVEVSLNGTTWTLAANTSGGHYQNEEKILLFDNAPLNNVRYIRITQSNTPSWFAIREFVVNKAYYLNNIYSAMPPKILNINEQPINTSTITSFPDTVYCSKALTYNWKKNGTAISGQNSQMLIITAPGNYTCDVTYSSSCGILLPLELTSFSVQKTNNIGTIIWHTQNEENGDRFEIERSLNGKDFEAILSIKAKNTREASYLAYDNDFEQLKTAIVYYRLKQIDKDGKFTYSKIVSINANNITKAQIFPNPVSSTATMQLQSQHAESVMLKIVSSDGKVLSTETYSLTAGNNLIALNTERLTTGVYAVVIAGQNTNEHLTFSKQ